MTNPLFNLPIKVYVASYANLAAFPSVGAENTIYINESINQLYVWTGSSYVIAGSNIIDGQVNTYADLPAASAHNGEVWLVTTSSGGFDAGFYVSNGTTWTIINLIPTGLSANNPLSYNDITGVLSLNYTSKFTLTSTSLDLNNNAVAYSNFQQVAANNLIGNPTGSLANATAIGLGTNLAFSAGNLTISSSPTFTRLNLSGLTASKLISTDGTNNLISSDLSGDVTTSGLTTTISNNAVTYAKIQNVSTNNRLLGRSTSGAGIIEEIIVGSGLSLSGGTLIASGLGGSVTSVSVASANGFAGTVANPTTTPAITLTTIITGIIKGNGTALLAAVAGTDYEVPLTFSTGLTRTTNTITVNTSQNISQLSNLITNGFVKTSSGNGTLTIDTNTYLTGNQTITLSGDTSGSGTTSITTTISSNAVTYAKIQQVAANNLIGNPTGSLANATAIGLGTNLAFSAGNLTISSSPTFTGLNLSGLTAGSILFSGTSGAIIQNNPQFFWDNTNNNLYINANSSSQSFSGIASLNIQSPTGSNWKNGLNIYSTLDQYPILTLFGFEPNTGSIFFDAYTNGNNTYTSSSQSGNFYIQGGGSALYFNVANGFNPGTNITWTQALSLSNAGVLNFNLLTASNALVLDGSKNVTTLGYGSANTINTLVERDGSGNFSAGTITVSALNVGTTTNSGPLTVQGNGGSTGPAAVIATFDSPSTPTAGNLFVIQINKSGVDALLLGVNKNSNTGQVPTNTSFISTYESTNGLSIGRGANNGLPNSTDILIDGSGNVTIPNGKLTLKTGTNGCRGSVTLSGSSTTVITTAAVTGCYIGISNTSPAGVTPAGSYTLSINNGVSFTINNGSSDSSTVQWFIMS